MAKTNISYKSHTKDTKEKQNTLKKVIKIKKENFVQWNWFKPHIFLNVKS